MERSSYPSDVTDGQWRLIEPWIPPPKPGGRPRSVDPREVITAMLYVVRTGCSWRQLPHDFPPWGTVYYYYKCFRENGTWRKIHDALRSQVRRRSRLLRQQQQPLDVLRGRGRIEPVIETVWYAYNAGGHVQEIVRKPASGGTYYRTFFLYDKGGQLWIARKDTWTNTGSGATSCDGTWAREFRYEGGRARYLMRPRDPDTLDPLTSDATWTDYDGNSVYQDYTVTASTGATTEVTRHLMGAWQQAVGSGDETFLHGDLIGTTRLMTDDAGTVGREVVYTAFGEMVYEDGTLETRYGYAGAHGYEGDAIGTGTNSLWDNPTDGLGLLHVGARLYDPSIGRFIMRDPAGLGGGLTVYLYCFANPLTNVDPSGMGPLAKIWGFVFGTSQITNDVVQIGDAIYVHYYEETTWLGMDTGNTYLRTSPYSCDGTFSKPHHPWEEDLDDQIRGDIRSRVERLADTQEALNEKKNLPVEQFLEKTVMTTRSNFSQARQK